MWKYLKRRYQFGKLTFSYDTIAENITEEFNIPLYRNRLMIE